MTTRKRDTTEPVDHTAREANDVTEVHANHIEHPADRLLGAIERLTAPVCVGLDPVLERLPGALSQGGDEPRAAAALLDFGRHILDAVAGIVPCVKLQSACYERYHAEGVAALRATIADAEARGLEVILDFKRGDIGISAEHYAAAAFDVEAAPRAGQPAWVTASPYLGADGLRPFLRAGRGTFALVRTSNPSGDAVQALKLADGRTVAEAVAGIVAELGATHVGERGYSALGAVVGATKPEAAARLRELMPRQLFLVPGFGAQGGGADDVKPCFRPDGTGAIVTASRSVIYAVGDDASDWQRGVADAARRFADQIGTLAGLR